MDLDPPAEGTPGQVVSYVHDSQARTRVADGVAAWFEQLARDLESGKYAVVNGRVKPV